MSTTTRTQRLEAALDRSSRNLGPALATRVDPATGHIRGIHRPPYTLPTRPPDESDAEGRPLADLTPDEYTLLIDQLLEDWDCPTMTELGLCRVHRLSLEQLDRITDDPAFDRALARIRSIRAKRRPEREAAARAQIVDRLLGLLAQPQDTATRAKEVRLACKQLQTILDTDAKSDSPGEAEPQSLGGAEFHSAIGQRPILPNTHNEIVGFPPSPPSPLSPSSPSPTRSPTPHLCPSVPSVVNPKNEAGRDQSRGLPNDSCTQLAVQLTDADGSPPARPCPAAPSPPEPAPP
jgi:hypothetical protein